LKKQIIRWMNFVFPIVLFVYGTGGAVLIFGNEMTRQSIIDGQKALIIAQADRDWAKYACKSKTASFMRVYWVTRTKLGLFQDHVNYNQSYGATNDTNGSRD
jgi:hypothetical protein